MKLLVMRGENTLLAYFVPKDETRYERVYGIPIKVSVTHNYGRRTHTCDFCGKVDPDVTLDQHSTKLDIKNYSKLVDSRLSEKYPDFASLVNVLVDASEEKNNMAKPNGFKIYNLEYSFKSAGKKVYVDEKNFPLKKIICTFKYSDLGTNNTYNYTVIQIKPDGTLIYPQVVKDEKELGFSVDTIAPVFVSYYTDENTVIEEKHISVNVLLWILLFALLFSALLIFYFKRPTRGQSPGLEN